VSEITANGRVICCDISEKHHSIIIGATDGVVSVIDTRTNKVSQTFVHPEPVSCIQCDLETKTLITGTNPIGSVNVFSLLEPHTPIKQINGIPASCIRYHNNRLVVGCVTGELMNINFSNDVAITNRLRTWARNAIVSIQFDDKKMVTAARDGYIRVWDNLGFPWYNVSGFTAYLSAVQFDECKLITDGENNIIRIKDFFLQLTI